MSAYTSYNLDPYTGRKRRFDQPPPRRLPGVRTQRPPLPSPAQVVADGQKAADAAPPQGLKPPPDPYRAHTQRLKDRTLAAGQRNVAARNAPASTAQSAAPTARMTMLPPWQPSETELQDAAAPTPPKLPDPPPHQSGPYQRPDEVGRAAAAVPALQSAVLAGAASRPQGMSPQQVADQTEQLGQTPGGRALIENTDRRATLGAVNQGQTLRGDQYTPQERQRLAAGGAKFQYPSAIPPQGLAPGVPNPGAFPKAVSEFGGWMRAERHDPERARQQAQDLAADPARMAYIRAKAAQGESWARARLAEVEGYREGQAAQADAQDAQDRDERQRRHELELARIRYAPQPGEPKEPKPPPSAGIRAQDAWDQLRTARAQLRDATARLEAARSRLAGLDPGIDKPAYQKAREEIDNLVGAEKAQRQAVADAQTAYEEATGALDASALPTPPDELPGLAGAAGSAPTVNLPPPPDWAGGGVGAAPQVGGGSAPAPARLTPQDVMARATNKATLATGETVYLVGDVWYDDQGRERFTGANKHL